MKTPEQYDAEARLQRRIDDEPGWCAQVDTINGYRAVSLYDVTRRVALDAVVEYLAANPLPPYNAGSVGFFRVNVWRARP